MTRTDTEQSHTITAVCGALLIALLVLFAQLVPAQSAQALATQVNEFPLGADDLFPGAIAQGPGGEMWFSNPKGTAGRSTSEQHPVGMIDRITPAGQITAFAFPETFSSSLAAGPDGNMWFTARKGVGFMTPSGQVTSFPVTMDFPGGIAAGPDGNMWFAARNEINFGFDKIGRVSPAGVIAEYRLPSRVSGPQDITAGSDGNLWFSEYFGRKIGRISPSGEIVEYRLPAERGAPSAITLGPDGNVWFAQDGGVGRVTPDGQITEFAVPGASGTAIAAGSDGRLWLPGPRGTIIRFNPAGRISRVVLPNRKSYPIDIAAGSDGDIWYTAERERCEGGGGTCMAMIRSQPGVVGRISNNPLTVAIKGRRAGAFRRWVKMTLACEGGDAEDPCHGKLRLRSTDSESGTQRSQSNAGFVVGAARFNLFADEKRTIAIRLTRGARAWLARRRTLRTVATTTVNGRRSSSPIVISRPRSTT